MQLEFTRTIHRFHRACMSFWARGIEFEDESRLKLEVSALLLLGQKIDTHFSDFLQSPNC